MILGICTGQVCITLNLLCRPPIGWGSTYCFTDVGVLVRVLVLVLVSVTPITKGTPAQIFFGRHVFCSTGHWLLVFAMTLTFALKVKLLERFSSEWVFP